MSETIKEAKTVEAAIAAALKELNRTREEVEIEILQEPVKGIFGLSKMAKVRAVNKTPEDFEPESREIPVADRMATAEEKAEAAQVVEKMLNLMGINKYEMQVRTDENNVVFQIESDSEGLLIGHHGRTLEAMQYLVNKIVGVGKEERIRYILDVGGYLTRRKETLEKIAGRCVKKVKETQQEVSLKAMSPVDRRIIHLFLKDDPDVKTYSEGEGTTRHIVIAPKAKE